jgi:hypothetical protein
MVESMEFLGSSRCVNGGEREELWFYSCELKQAEGKREPLGGNGRGINTPWAPMVT